MSDTDSILVLKCDPYAPSLESLFRINNKLGGLKKEAVDIEYFVGLAAKLYM